MKNNVLILFLIFVLNLLFKTLDLQFRRFPNPIKFIERNRCVTRREKTQSTTHIVTAQVTICLSCGPYCFWV